VTKTFAQREEKIAGLEWELQQLRDAQAKYLALPEVDRVAEDLHSMLCHSNHTDACDWDYGNGSARTRYFGKANRLLDSCKTHNISTADAINILKIAISS